MSMHFFFQNILEMFLKGEEPTSLEEKEVLREISTLVAVIVSNGKPYVAESNQIYCAFKRLESYLPESISPEQLRILCNLCYMGKLTNATTIEDWTIPEPSHVLTSNGHSVYDPRYRGAYGKGFRDLIAHGAEVVGFGEVKIFFPNK